MDTINQKNSPENGENTAGSHGLNFGNQIIPLPISIGLLLILGVVFYLYAWPWIYWSIPWLYPDDLPGLQDHWHARYQIKACGLVHPPLPRSEGDIHSHGDGLIHIHPSTSSTAGRKANIGAFFESAGGTIGNGRLTVPPLLDLRNGDECQNGQKGYLQVYVNNRKIDDPAGYVPGDGDTVVIYFGERLPPMKSPKISQTP